MINSTSVCSRLLQLRPARPQLRERDAKLPGHGVIVGGDKLHRHPALLINFYLLRLIGTTHFAQTCDFTKQGVERRHNREYRNKHNNGGYGQANNSFASSLFHNRSLLIYFGRRSEGVIRRR